LQNILFSNFPGFAKYKISQNIEHSTITSFSGFAKYYNYQFSGFAKYKISQNIRFPKI
jgi:hypothetical protein